MIERDLKNVQIATPSVLNPIYKMLVLLLVLLNNSSHKGAKIGRIQICLWGMSGNQNKQILLNYKESGNISEMPITLDPQLRIILADAEQRGWIEQVADGKTYSRYMITLRGSTMLYDLRNLNIYKEIEEGLSEIVRIPDTKIDNINYVWTNDIF
ncbi:hypothetical protein [uncultured Bacteroides sp.]|uniref:hypothetical protein n=1 Tax=uncultured Bacteroides sp. TaxID=162156 RepID=UPI002AABA8FC|nr:hypothetical protein [uncultured Bacteroides sp.]